MDFRDARIALLVNCEEASIRSRRHDFEIRPVYKRVDSCAAEFPTSTAYMYSTYEVECESEPQNRNKIMVLGGGPNRIGQGIEFDYCCVHAAMALREAGYQTIMVNCNPETVSTDYDTSDRLYFEPLTFEDVLEIIETEQPTGVIVHYGGQTPLKLARELKRHGVPIIGTSPESIHRAEDREEFQKLLSDLKLEQPPNGTASSLTQAVEVAESIGYPLIVRPSYVLGGRAMEIIYDDRSLQRYMQNAIDVSNDSPVLLDRFLDNAREVDVDVICDGERVVIGGVMEHIQEAGVHSGDSACSLPAFSLSETIQAELRAQAEKLALAIGVVGLMNVQFAVQDTTIFVLEVNPRASRTIPFISKVSARPLAKIAALCMAGISLDEQGIEGEAVPNFYGVKEAVFPFIKLPGVDTVLGPEMRSTGEVMGVGSNFGCAFNKSQMGAGLEIPEGGNALFSIRDEDKPAAIALASYLQNAGFAIFATKGTSIAFAEAGIETKQVNKVLESRPHIVDMIIDGGADLVINTPSSYESIEDSFTIRREALMHKVTYYTNIAAAVAAGEAHKQRKLAVTEVNKLQSLHNQISIRKH